MPSQERCSQLSVRPRRWPGGAKSLAGTGAPASAGGMLAGLNDFVTEFLATAQSFDEGGTRRRALRIRWVKSWP